MSMTTVPISRMQVSQGICVFFSNSALWVQNKALGGMLIVSFDLGIALGGGGGGKLLGVPFSAVFFVVALRQ